MTECLPPCLSCKGKTESILSQTKITSTKTSEVPRQHFEKTKEVSCVMKSGGAEEETPAQQLPAASPSPAPPGSGLAEHPGLQLLPSLI